MLRHAHGAECLHGRHDLSQRVVVKEVLRHMVGKYGWVDLVIGGTPCNDATPLTTDGDGFDGSKSALYERFVFALREVRATLRVQGPLERSVSGQTAHMIALSPARFTGTQ